MFNKLSLTNFSYQVSLSVTELELDLMELKLEKLLLIKLNNTSLNKEPMLSEMHTKDSQLEILKLTSKKNQLIMF
jgi:hypothetical protein